MSQNKLLLFLVTIISLIAIISFSISPVFSIRDIKYRGLQFLEENELNGIMDRYYQNNIFLINHRRIKKRLEGLNYIKNVSVVREYPGTLVIIIEERIPVARIINNGKYLTFTADGYIVETGSFASNDAVPVIEGMGYSLDKNRISFSPVMEEVVQALDSISQNTRRRITAISLADNLITARSNKTPVELGSPRTLTKKLRVLESLLQKIEREDLTVEYIDLSIIKKPVVKVKR